MFQGATALNLDAKGRLAIPARHRDALAALTLQILNELGLHASLGVFHDRGLEYFYDDGIKRPIEQEVIENSRHLGRISDFSSRTILNYPHFGLRDREMYYEWMLLDTHDAMTDVYKHRRTRGEVRKLLTELGAEEVEVWHGGNGVEASCRKPASG